MSLRIPLPSLIDWREREEKELGRRKLRHDYLASIEAHVRDLTSEQSSSEADAQEKKRKFDSDMEDDLSDLKKSLDWRALRQSCRKRFW